jgi:superoxide dismutase, Cu-Zn family
VKHLLTAFGLGVALVVAAPPVQAQSPVTARADMVDLEGRPAGQATFEQTPQGVLITVELQGLPPGWRGIHIHENAACQPPFASAGEHFNPTGEAHGYRTEGLHAGDLPNIFVADDGTATAQMINDRVALSTERPTDVAFLNRALGAVQDAAGLRAHNLLEGSGTALIVHSGADDHRTDPDGDAGDRIACGVIQR